MSDELELTKEQQYDWNKFKNERRDDMWRQVARNLLLLNGGGAVALLAFVQSAWKTAPLLVPWVAWSLIAMVVGVISGASIPYLREHTVLFWDADSQSSGQRMKQYRWCAKVSIIFFALAVGIVAVGILSNLPGQGPTG